MKTFNVLVFVVALSMANARANGVSLVLTNGKALASASVMEACGTRVKIMHSAGVEWFDRAAFDAAGQAYLSTNKAPFEQDETPYVFRERPTLDVMRWLPVLSRCYGVDASGTVYRSGAGGYETLSGSVLSVINGQTVLLTTPAGSVVALAGITADGLVDGQVVERVGLRDGVYRYTSVMGAEKSVAKYRCLAPLAAEDVQRRGLRSFPEYVAGQARMKELEAEREESARRAAAAEMEAGKRRLRTHLRNKTYGSTVSGE
jgi:hypothetical protein